MNGFLLHQQPNTYEELLNISILLYFVYLFTSVNKSQSFETHVPLFMFQVHGNLITGENDVVLELEHLRSKQCESWNRIQNLLMENMCLTTFLRCPTL